MTTKWSAFPSGSAVASGDIFVGLQGGANVQWTGAQLLTFVWASPTLVTPALGVATATSVAIGGATLGTRALSVLGTSLLTGGTLADQAQVLAITATQPASPTGEQNAILETIAGAGSASQANYARKTLFNSGYTGTSFNAAASFVNLNAGTLSSGVFIGLANTTPSVGAALIVDNGATTQPIFLARDNGTTVFTIADGGNVTLANSTTLTTYDIINSIGTYGASSGGSGFWISTSSRIAFGGNFGGPFLGYATAERLTLTSAGGSPAFQFGGTTSSFPAIKRSTTVLQFKLADDSAFTSFTATTGILNALATDAGQTDVTVCADSTTGQLYKGSGTIGICLGTSSARYKDQIREDTDGLAELIQLQPKKFRYIKGFGDDGAREQVGFLAEDVVRVLPGLVGPDALGRPNSVDIVGMIPVIIRSIQELKAVDDDKDQLLAVAIRAIQEQQVQIEELKARQWVH